MENMNILKEKFQELQFISEGKLDQENKNLNRLLLVHAFNISNDLDCIGLNEDDGEEESILPQKWNIGDEGVYSFKYRTKKDKNAFIFKIIFDGDSVNVNAVSLKDSSKLYSSTIQLDQLNLEQIEKNAAVYEAYKKDILAQIVDAQNKQSNQSSTSSYGNNSNSSQYYGNIPYNQSQGNFGGNQFDPMRDYGRSDLQPNFGNPFINGGQGTNPLMNPYGRNNQPRFDPLGPGGFNGIPDDIQPGFFPNNNQGPNRGGGRGPIGGPFGGGLGGGLGGGFNGGFGGGLC